MPVTARLSSRFYERFGDETTNELVNWFNAVDATYRSDLRELNELNFARFDAKLEQRLAQFEAKFETRLSQQTRWLFAAWAAVFGAVLSIWAGLIMLFLRQG